MDVDYQVVIIGGGITGAGLLKEAVSRGYSAILLEQEELGGKTTAASSGLIHGGLRYLATDFAASKACSLEAGRIKSLFSGGLRRQVFLWSVYSGQKTGLELVEALLESYDAIAPLKYGLPHVRLSAEEALELEPGLSPKGLKGAVTFDEWSVNPVELVREIVGQAGSRGAAFREKAKVVGFLREGNRIYGARIWDKKSGREDPVFGEILINASGPWARETALMAGAGSVRLRLRKGVHLILPRQGIRHAVLIEDSSGRVLGAYPRGEELWIGPTDDPFEGDLDDIAIRQEEKSRLVSCARAAFPGLDFENHRFVAGVRPVLFHRGIGASLARDYRVYDHEALDGIRGLLTVTGGKMVLYLRMAEEALDLVDKKLGRPSPLVAAKERSPDWRENRTFSIGCSLARLGYYGARHFLGFCGPARRGLETFRRTYEA